MDSAQRHVAAEDEDPVAALAAELAQAATVMFSAGTVTGPLAQVAGLAVSAIEGRGFACVSLHAGEALAGPAHASTLADRLEALRRDSGEEPCPGAAAHGASPPVSPPASSAALPGTSTSNSGM